MTMADADRLVESLRHEMLEHIPALGVATVRVTSRTVDDAVSANGQKGLQQFRMTEPAGHGY
jgi:hypothetical protein